MIVPLLILGAAVALYLNRVTDLDVTSSKEGMSSQPITIQIDASDSVGWPYFYSRGAPSTPWVDGKKGVDCGGYALMVSVHIGDILPTCPDMNTSAIADACDKVEVGSQGPGDFAYYPGHIMVVATDPGADGHSGVIGCSGGGRLTLGNDPKACVKTFVTALYRDDFVCYMRWKPDFKYLVS